MSTPAPSRVSRHRRANRSDDGRRFPSALALGLSLYATVTPAVVAALVLARSHAVGGARISFGAALVWQLLVYAAWAANAAGIVVLGRRWRVGDHPWRAPLPAYAVATLVSVPAQSAWDALVAWRARPAPAGGRPPLGSAFGPLFAERVPVNLLIGTAIVAAVYAVEHYRLVQQRNRAAAALEGQLALAQLHAVTAQLRPHFLFNALQAIATLIRTSPDDAVAMTVRLGALLRETLHRSGCAEVPLRDELRLLEHYLAIERVRFRDRLRVTIDVPPDAARCAVPDMLLQPLVENAVRHGLAEKPEGGTITIGARCDGDRLTVLVRDTGVGLLAGFDARRDAGVGLTNTATRLRQLYGDDHELWIGPDACSGGTLVRLTIPCRTPAPAESGDAAAASAGWG